jgi:hypothetical protein
MTGSDSNDDLDKLSFGCLSITDPRNDDPDKLSFDGLSLHKQPSGIRTPYPSSHIKRKRVSNVITTEVTVVKCIKSAINDESKIAQRIKAAKSMIDMVNICLELHHRKEPLDAPEKSALNTLILWVNHYNSVLKLY